MKKILFILIIVLQALVVKSQDSTQIRKDSLTKNTFKQEVSIDWAALVWENAVNIGYERFYKKNQSLSLILALNSIYKINSTPNNLKSSYLGVHYNFYFSKKTYQGFVVSPFIRLRHSINNPLEYRTTDTPKFINFLNIGLRTGYKAKIGKISFIPFLELVRGYHKKYYLQINDYSSDSYNIRHLKYSVGMQLAYPF